ncbi:DNA topoisomerase 3-alpha [Oopsacas minuta]|uniref:DNA topoisomerase n=1 Tax=Oopsacas minuta TaxID=111878 RepID=A0AAV7JZB2_9METZ|nr:DNA topoisomerase 3-alpha [Oopsacas minuta]
MTLKVLCVAEKNDAAREISRLLSNNQSSRREGLSKFNKIYEFSCEMLNNNASVSMTSVSGHLMTYDFTGPFKGWEKCPPVALFSAPILSFCPENYQPIKKTLEREAKKNEVLVLWTDCDREGENIGAEIRDVCLSANNRIRVYRARFSEITFRSIKTAIQRLESLDEKLAAAVYCRQELDLRIGAAFTRFLTLRLQKVFPADLADQLVSYGPCQFPTLGFVVDRYKQVQQFVPETFYKLKAVVMKNDISVDFSWSRGRLFNRAVTEIFLEMCQEHPTAVVSRVASKSKSKWRPLPLDTVEFEKHASRKLHINAKQAMSIAEKLYTQGLISYPRTETNLFPASMNLVPLVQEQTQDGQWGDMARQILADTPNPRRGNKSDQAHPPIHPIKYAPNLQGDEKKVYEFIVRHFLACCSKDAQGMETSVDICVSQEEFSAAGLVITQRNYLEVYPYDKWSDKNIPNFTQGESLPTERIELVEGETTPPLLLKEADLIALMEKHGIGTDATHAEHIETIKSRRYVGVQQDGTFLPGMLGMGLVEGYDEIGYNLSKPYLRAELEADLKAICLGQKNKDDVIKSMVEKYKQVFIETTANAIKIDQSLSSYFGTPEPMGPEQGDMRGGGDDLLPLAKCRSCLQFDMYFKTTREEKWILSCVGYPQCKYIVFFPSGVTHAKTESEQLCNRCPHPPVHKARLTFERGTIPYFLQGDIPNVFIGCLFCNEDIKRAGIELRNMSSHPPTVAHSHNSYQSVVPQNSFTIQDTPHNSNNNNPIASGRRDLGFDPTNPPPPVKRYSDGTSHYTKHPRVTEPPSGGDDDNFVVCNCGARANLLTVKKEGPNTGRKFYTCMTNSCKYFLWDPRSDPSMDTRPPRQDPTQMSSYVPPTGDPFMSLYPNRPDSNSHNQSVCCRCGEQAKLLTVQKQGNNHGKQFYSCPKPREQGCNFFQWADEERRDSFSPPQRGRGGNSFSKVSRGGPRLCSICRQAGHNKKNCPNSNPF